MLLAGGTDDGQLYLLTIGSSAGTPGNAPGDWIGGYTECGIPPLHEPKLAKAFGPAGSQRERSVMADNSG